MKLSYILEQTNYIKYYGDIDIEIENLSSNSNEIKKNGIFIAIKGYNIDGNTFIPHAIKKGAKIIVTENSFIFDDVTTVKVKCSRVFFAEISKIFYNSNCDNLKFFGITGTNGKTSVSFMIKSILDLANKKNGLIGTIHNEFSDFIFPSVRTTPEADDLHKLLNRMERSDCENVIMEVSSHSISQKRVHGIKFNMTIFTNLTEEHLDFHSSMDDYFRQKKKLFYQMKNNFSPIIINIDDNYGLKLYEEFKSQSLTYGLSQKASYRATEIKIKKNKTKFLLVDPQNKKTRFIIPFIGIHNVYNALASVVALHKSGLKLNEIKKNFLKVKDIPGRLQLVSKKNKKLIYIDYAHTEKALLMVLQSLNLIRKNKLWLVFGCGGNRDKNKRQKMGQVAKFYADNIIITSDNPRYENELDICNEIMIGCTNHDNVKIILDRKKAIKTAINKSQKNDIILIAGKGHENYQEINGKMITFNDAEVVHEVLNDK